MQNGHHPDKPYILATGEKAVSRLVVLERIFGPATRHLLSAARLCSGMRVAEIGCGTASQHDGWRRRSAPAEPWWAWTRVLGNCTSERKARQKPASQIFHSAKTTLTKPICRGILLILFIPGSYCAISLILPRHWRK